MSAGVAITGAGVWTPPDVISNEELCTSFNTWARGENERNATAIAAGDAELIKESTPEFILKASGVEQRYVLEKEGVLDPERMFPRLEVRPEDQISLQAEAALEAANRALAAAGKTGKDVDMILLAAAAVQRYYPAISVEVQAALGAEGFAIDMLAGCSSATFPMRLACDAIKAGSIKTALLINPELTSPWMNWKDRDSHFIFGDAATALVVENSENAGEGSFDVLGTHLYSKFSSNIRNNGGYMSRCEDGDNYDASRLFHQQGRRVFKDIVPLASEFITDHLHSLGIKPQEVSRYWLHQANINLNALVIKRILGAEPTPEQAPSVLATYGNTASAGSIIAFHDHKDDLPAGSIGVLCSFGAGYSIGNVVLRKR